MREGVWKKYQCTKCRRKFIVNSEPGEKIPRLDDPNCPYGCTEVHSGELVYTTFDSDVEISMVK